MFNHIDLRSISGIYLEAQNIALCLLFFSKSNKRIFLAGLCR